MSLWTRPRWCSLPTAAAMPMARRRKRLDLHRRGEQPLERLEPPTSSSTSMVRPPSRTSSSGRDRPRSVQLVLQSVFVGEAIEARAASGCAATGSTASTALRPPSSSSATLGGRRVRRPPIKPDSRYPVRLRQQTGREKSGRRRENRHCALPGLSGLFVAEPTFRQYFDGGRTELSSLSKVCTVTVTHAPRGRAPAAEEGSTLRVVDGPGS